MADVHHRLECGREFTNGGVGATRGFMATTTVQKDVGQPPKSGRAKNPFVNGGEREKEVGEIGEGDGKT